MGAVRRHSIRRAERVECVIPTFVAWREDFPPCRKFFQSPAWPMLHAARVQHRSQEHNFADARARNKSGLTSLHLVARYGSPKMPAVIWVWLGAGADPKMRGRGGAIGVFTSVDEKRYPPERTTRQERL